MSLFEKIKDKQIKDLKVGVKVDWYYKLTAIQKRTKRDGNPYLALELMDSSGRISAKVWDNVESFLVILQEGKVYRVAGIVNEYMNKKEIKIDALSPVSPGDKDFDESDFNEKPAFDTDAQFNKMIATLKENIKNEFLLQLIDLFVQEYKDKFKNHYGAQKIHHAYVGGLLKHTASMVKLALPIAEQYKLDKELLLIGVLFHDVGKMFEFDIEPSVHLTMEGGLLGHLMIGLTIFQNFKDKIKNFPADLSIKIQHMIISHHGEREFGAPEPPKMPEAFALHVIDLLDSKLNIISEALLEKQNAMEEGEKNGINGGTTGDNLFTDWLRPLERRIFIDQPNKGLKPNGK